MACNNVPSLSSVRNQKRQAAVERDMNNLCNRIASVESIVTTMRDKLDILIKTVASLDQNKLNDLEYSDKMNVHRPADGDEQLASRIGRLELLLFRVPLPDFEVIDERIQMVLPKMVSASEASDIATPVSKPLISDSQTKCDKYDIFSDEEESVVPSKNALGFSYTPVKTKIRRIEDTAMERQPNFDAYDELPVSLPSDIAVRQAVHLGISNSTAKAATAIAEDAGNNNFGGSSDDFTRKPHAAAAAAVAIPSEMFASTSTMTKKDMKSRLKSLGLPLTGSQHEMAARLLNE